MRRQEVLGLSLALLAPILSNGCFLYSTPWDPPEAETSETDGSVDKTFFLSEVTTYSSAELDGCKASDVAVITEDFKNKLLLDQWSGTRRTSYQTRPSDFYDQGYAGTVYGKDHLYADASRVAVFAGHGHIGVHGFILPDPESPLECRGFTSVYLGGQGQGDQQSLFINAASCGGAFGDEPGDPFECFSSMWNHSQFRQWLGFADSPVIDPLGLSTFYDSLPPNYDSLFGNLDTWIDVMEFPESGVRTAPVVYTKETTDEGQLGAGEDIHYEMNMRSGKYMTEADNPPQKHSLLMSPAYPVDGMTNFCVGGLFSC